MDWNTNVMQGKNEVPMSVCLTGVLGIVTMAAAPMGRKVLLAGIKLLHTAIWLFFAGCIVAIPFAGAQRQFLWAPVLTGLVLVECAVLAVNRGRCPLTDLAGRYTKARTDNFDIC